MKKLSIAKEYTTKDGEVKTQWYNVGALITKSNGKQTVILEDSFNYAAFAKGGKVFLNVTEPQNNNSKSSDKPDFDDDIPF